MISKITLDKTIVPFADGQIIEPKMLNFVFGNNATGKTTISKLIYRAISETGLPVCYDDDDEIFVYNRDFVSRTFHSSNEIPGVFTLGEERADIEEKIELKKKELHEADDDIKRLKGSLLDIQVKEDESEKRSEEDCWESTRDIREQISSAISGYRFKKPFFKKCYEKFTGERLLTTREALISEVKRAFSQTLEEQELQEEIAFEQIEALEGNEILGKVITGDKNIEIGKLIEILHNSDWVKRGLEHFENSKHICPFCQQTVDEKTERQLREFFNEQFERDVADLEELTITYETLTDEISNKIYVVTTEFVEGYDSEIEALLTKIKAIIEQNINKLNLKRKEPSTKIELISICGLIKLVNNEIKKRNEVIIENNRIFATRKEFRPELSERVIGFIANNILITIFNRFRKDKENCKKAREAIERKIDADIAKMGEAQAEIEANEKKLTSVISTARRMQELLSRFGYNSFMITTTDDEKNFRLVRKNGECVQQTLSEGEFRFITFLYYYFLINGSDKPSMSGKKKVIVIDDPICSMDNQALFLTLGLIHNLVEQCKKGQLITQVIIMTHNMFFYQQLIEPYRENKKSCPVNFIYLKKEDTLSYIQQSNKNKIESSYEMLWRYILSENSTQPELLLNTMRRILDDFFCVFLGTKKLDFINNFDEKDRPICRALFSRLNAGSHSIPDDYYFSSYNESISDLRRVFKEIFTKAGYLEHYAAMEERAKEYEL